MKNLVFLFLAVCLLSCSTTQQVSQSSSTPKLILQNPFPAIPASTYATSFSLNVLLLVLEDGSVGEVHIVKGTEDTLWNAQAAETIRHWKFLPAMSDGKPVQMWFHLQTNVHFARPVNFTLAQIVCNSQKDADSVYTALEHGNSFTELAKTYSRDSASRVNDGTMGMMNIYALPQELRRPIEDLSVNEYTEPIGYGNLFFIFKRLPQ